MTLNLTKVSDAYFNQLFLSGAKDSKHEKNLKVLMLDNSTKDVVSISYTQTQLLMNNIVLVELISGYNNLKQLKHLSCIVFIKPTKESLKCLQMELKNPHFNKYEVYFNNTVSKTQLEEIARADESESVIKIMELFEDYMIINSNLFQISNTVEFNPAEEASSLASLLLSLGKCPIIKYDNSYLDPRKISSELLYGINSNSNNNLFDDLNKSSDVPPILLLLDRKFDLITPLVTPWTYQSMIHELIGISKNIVDLPDSEEQLILSESQDTFFHESMYLNYGDLTEKFQAYVESYKKSTKQTSIENLKTQNLTELKRLLTSFPEFKKTSSNILKHLNIISELDKQISLQNLWEVGELQQIILGQFENQSAINEKVITLFSNPAISMHNKIKILLIYIYKYPQSKTDVGRFLSRLKDPSLGQDSITTYQEALIKEYSKNFRSSEPLADRQNQSGIASIFANKKVNINHLFGSVNKHNGDANNIYMQYIPKLDKILYELINPIEDQGGKNPTLKTLVPDVVSKQYGNRSQGVQDVIIYIKGGVTYEEARLVHDYNMSNPKINLVIGGDVILNSEKCLNMVYNVLEKNNNGENADPYAEPVFRQFRDIL